MALATFNVVSILAVLVASLVWGLGVLRLYVHTSIATIALLGLLAWTWAPWKRRGWSWSRRLAALGAAPLLVDRRMAVWFVAVALPCGYVLGQILTERWRATEVPSWVRFERILDHPAYSLTLDAEEGQLLVHHAHTRRKPWGLTLIDPRSEPPTTHLFEIENDHVHWSFPLIGRRAIVAVETDPREGRGGAGPVRLQIIDLDSSTREVVQLPDWADQVWCGVYDPRNDQLYLGEKHKAPGQKEPFVHVLPFDRLRDPSAEPLASYRMEHLPGIEELRLHPGDAARVLARSEGMGATRVADLRLSGRGWGRYVRILPWHKELEVDAEQGRVLVSRSIGQEIVEVDLGTFLPVARIQVGGTPEAARYLHGTGLMAVGSYMGRKVLLLDRETHEVKARLPACNRVRDLAWDAKRSTLYTADTCGVMRIRIVPPAQPDD